jgi:hypothetical protein
MQLLGYVSVIYWVQKVGITYRSVVVSKQDVLSVRELARSLV